MLSLTSNNDKTNLSIYTKKYKSMKAPNKITIFLAQKIPYILISDNGHLNIEDAKYVRYGRYKCVVTFFVKHHHVRI
jgi:hypothetical protein